MAFAILAAGLEQGLAASGCKTWRETSSSSCVMGCLKQSGMPVVCGEKILTGKGSKQPDWVAGGGLKFPSHYQQVRQVVLRDDKAAQPASRLEKRLNEPLRIFPALFFL